MRVQLRPSVAEDFAALAPLLGGRHPYRARTLTATLDGEVLGVGGLVYLPNGEIWASVVMSEKARGFPAAIHRAGRAAMTMMRESGARRVLASADGDPRGERWLLRLGFVRLRGEVFEWRPHR